MKNVLVPIDGSASAERALAHALTDLQRLPGGQLHLLNVQAPLVQPWPSKLVSPEMIAAERRQEGEKLLAPLQARAAQAGVPCTLHVRIGQPGDQIAACAAEAGCDAVVMGTRGMGAVAGLMLGSVATRVVHAVQVPVTLVK
jgi:nucleotide-binding universal stress UspA family protein